MFALVDCNNFYVSCERVFNPNLKGKPVIVLSNNDGCAISRSQEAKDLGVEMGSPLHLIKDLVKEHNIKVFSSNYTLYGDMSWRVNEVLSMFTPNVEVYSIDECFLDLSGFLNKDLAEYGKEIRKTVLQWTGIPTCVGIAPTKALAKIANKLAKKEKVGSGVRLLQREQDIENALRIIDIKDVWGIGRQYAAMLKFHGVNTAYDFTQLNGAWVKDKMSIVGYRLWQELKGKSCLSLDLVVPPKKGICSSRSFGKHVTSLNDLKEAISSHASKCAEKLRKQHSCATNITVFINTNPFKKTDQYHPSKVLKLPVASCSTPELIKYALLGLDSIFKDGIIYNKCGVIVTGIIPANEVQQDMFDNQPREKVAHLMKTIDKVNNLMGKDTLRFSVQGYKKAWEMKREMLSPQYTTKLSDILTIKL